MTELERFHHATEDEATSLLLACCGSRAWAAELVRLRGSRETPHDHREEAAVIMGHPGFASGLALVEAGSAVWFGLGEADWLDAFACHPRIGERPPAQTGFLAHSEGEQAALRQTLAAVAARLAEGNRAYEARFGFVYLVFASGRTAPELLAVLEQRLHNTREDELQEAARQQDRITRLRMERWLAL